MVYGFPARVSLAVDWFKWNYQRMNTQNYLYRFHIALDRQYHIHLLDEWYEESHWQREQEMQQLHKLNVK